MIKKSAKIIIINKNGKILTYLRDNNSKIPYSNFWDFLGGGIENQETVIQAIERELKEELNIPIYGIELAGSIEVKSDKLWGNNPYIVTIFIGYTLELDNKNIHITEGVKSRFCLNEVKKTENLIEFYLKFLEKNKEKLSIL